MQEPDRNIKLRMKQMKDMFELKVEELENEIEIIEKARDKFRDRALDLKQQLKKSGKISQTSKIETRADSFDANGSKMSIYDKLKTYQTFIKKKELNTQSMKNLHHDSFEAYKREPNLDF